MFDANLKILTTDIQWLNTDIKDINETKSSLSDELENVKKLLVLRGHFHFDVTFILLSINIALFSVKYIIIKIFYLSELMLFFSEPVTAKYLYVDPKTNLIHLLAPIVSGQEISTDNTCRKNFELVTFFQRGALLALENYKKELERDLNYCVWFKDPVRLGKCIRLLCINKYIKAVAAMQEKYPAAIEKVLKKPSNLYSLQLRPREQDSASRVINPIFNINRKNDENGEVLSCLYKAIHNTFTAIYHLFGEINIALPDLRSQLISEVLKNTHPLVTFAEIQHQLATTCLSLFAVTIDFNKDSDGSDVSKEEIDTLMGFDDTTSVTEYIEALLGVCAPNIWDNIPNSPFYNLSANISAEEKIDTLSIMIQFLLAHFNIYCRAKNISGENFGNIFDQSSSLSYGLITNIIKALSMGVEIETTVCNFFNSNTEAFKLLRSLTKEDVAYIKNKFECTYRTVTATNENPHMDDFMFLDTEAEGENAIFFTHQGKICINFAELVDPSLPDQGFFTLIKDSFTNHSAEIQHKNVCITTEGLYEYEVLFTAIINGKQKEAEFLLNSLSKPDIQNLLIGRLRFTDNSGRSFHCSAYEYAFWVKDSHMCKMLQQYMDMDSKWEIYSRLNPCQYNGLQYYEKGKKYQSEHYDFRPLEAELTTCIHNYKKWIRDKNYTALQTSWLNIGKLQRDIPTHMVQILIGLGCKIQPIANTWERPQEVMLEDINTPQYKYSWFPLEESDLGSKFTIGVIVTGAVAINVDAIVNDILFKEIANNFWYVMHQIDKIRTEEVRQLTYELVPSSNFSTLLQI